MLRWCDLCPAGTVSAARETGRCSTRPPRRRARQSFAAAASLWRGCRARVPACAWSDRPPPRRPPSHTDPPAGLLLQTRLLTAMLSKFPCLCFWLSSALVVAAHFRPPKFKLPLVKEEDPSQFVQAGTGLQRAIVLRIMIYGTFHRSDRIVRTAESTRPFPSAGCIWLVDIFASRPGRHVPAHRIGALRSEEHTSELQSPMYLVCRLL